MAEPAVPLVDPPVRKWWQKFPWMRNLGIIAAIVAAILAYKLWSMPAPTPTAPVAQQPVAAVAPAVTSTAPAPAQKMATVVPIPGSSLTLPARTVRADATPVEASANMHAVSDELEQIEKTDFMLADHAAMAEARRISAIEALGGRVDVQKYLAKNPKLAALLEAEANSRLCNYRVKVSAAYRALLSEDLPRSDLCDK